MCAYCGVSCPSVLTYIVFTIFSSVTLPEFHFERDMYLVLLFTCCPVTWPLEGGLGQGVVMAQGKTIKSLVPCRQIKYCP